MNPGTHDMSGLLALNVTTIADIDPISEAKSLMCFGPLELSS